MGSQRRRPLVFVVEIGGKVVGFVCGWEKAQQQYERPLLQSYGLILATSLLKSCLRHPKCAFPLVQPRLRALARFASEWPSLLMKSKRKDEAGNPLLAPVGQGNESEPAFAALMSIAVLPQYQGTDAATLLHSAFVEECRRRQVSEILLTTHVQNSRARSFYEKNGWQLSRQDEQSVHYRLSLSKH